jgi:hypothetical protein
MVVTLAVFQVAIGWLNDLASWNIPSMRVTLAVYHLATGWSNSLAPLNM